MPTPIQTFVPIANWVATGTTQSLTISSIDQGYDHLVITGGFTRNINGDFGGRSAQFQWNGVTSNYKNVGFYANAVGSNSGRSYSDSSGPNAPAGNQYYQSGRQAFEYWIPNYSKTIFQKHVLQREWVNDTGANNGGIMRINDTLIPISGALTSLYVFEQVDAFVAGDWLTIYGVKNA